MAKKSPKSGKKSTGGGLVLKSLADFPAQPTEINDRVRYYRSHWAEGTGSAKKWQKRKLHWRFNPKNLTLHRADGRYEIDLEKIKTSASMLDWIFQLQAKSWVSDESLADLIMFFRVLFRPQGTLCSQGREQGPINPRKVISENMKGWQ